MRRAISITVLSALAGLAQAQDTNNFDCSNFLQFGADINQTRTAFAQSPETMAWNWFVCLNQPSTAQSSNLVWEMMKPSDQVYLPNGAPPGTYDSSAPLPDAVVTQAKAQGMDLSRSFHNINATQQVDGLILQWAVPCPIPNKAIRYAFSC